MTKEDELILESCERYKKAGLKTKYVELQYKRLTGDSMEGCKTGILGYQKMLIGHTVAVAFYVLEYMVCISVFSSLKINMIEWFGGLALVLLGFGCFIEISSLIIPYMTRVKYIEQEVTKIESCNSWLTDVLVGMGVFQVSVPDTKLIEECCEKHILTGKVNKGTVKSYKSLTGKELNETTKKHIIHTKYIIFELIKSIIYGVVISYLMNMLCKAFQVYEYIAIKGLVKQVIPVVIVIFRSLYQYIVKPKKYRTLQSVSPAFIDYIVEMGYVRCGKEMKEVN